MRRSLARLAVVVAALLAQGAAGAAVRVAEIRQPVHPVSAAFLDRVLAAAAAANDELVVVQLDTPGGLGSSMDHMVQAILASSAPVCIHVTPGGARAASAGFLLLLSADLAAMAPGTHTGSAHPIFTGEEVIEAGKRHIMMEKVENDAAAFVRTLAENRRRNVTLSEKVVRESANLTEREALDQGLVDLIATDLDDLLRQVDGRQVRRFDGELVTLATRGLTVVRMEMTARERLLAAIANPALAFVLLSLGMIGLWVEFSHPGLILPGAVGAVALLLFGFSTQILPVNWVGLLLVVMGVGLFLLEIKITSYGALTAGGIACLILGGLMLYDTPAIPELRVPLALLLAASFAVGGITAGLLRLVVRAHRRSVTTGAEGLIGELAVVLEDCAPAGRVFVHGEAWNAVADPPLRRGEEARVVQRDGLQLRVERVPGDAPAAAGVAARGRRW